MLQDIQRHHHVTKVLFTILVATILLIIIGASLFYFLGGRSNNPLSRVGLGSLEYVLKDDHYVKRTDTATNELRAFLEDLNRTSGCPESVYHEVIAVTPDETQVLLRYGCDSATARMFAVKVEGSWRTLSPTNQFDQFGIPLCDHVTSNNISRTIAPVCVTHIVGASPKYIAR